MEQSTNYAEPSITEYDERRAKQLEFWKAQDGQQSGDPAKLARALIIASQVPPPRRFIAGAEAIATAEQKVADLKAQIDGTLDVSRIRPSARRMIDIDDAMRLNAPLAAGSSRSPTSQTGTPTGPVRLNQDAIRNSARFRAMGR
jgi:hypothetical protein